MNDGASIFGEPDDLSAFHPLANAFPLLQGLEFQQLVEDIEANGQLEPCVMLDGLVLDGRNRWRACREIGREPQSVEFAQGDPLAFVVAKNLRRRHLSESQRAMIAANLANMPRGRRREDKSAPARISQAEAASLLNVSTRSVSAAATVLREGAPGLAEKVRDDVVAVKVAEAIARHPTTEQERLLQKVGEATAEADGTPHGKERMREAVREAVRTTMRAPGKPPGALVAPAGPVHAEEPPDPLSALSGPANGAPGERRQDATRMISFITAIRTLNLPDEVLEAMAKRQAPGLREDRIEEAEIARKTLDRWLDLMRLPVP